ncbi:MAG: hypothetical protein NT086_02665 [Proteobacteria bacterium]|nr:hypothetical protein [Pseudomonadota bacterium]
MKERFRQGLKMQVASRIKFGFAEEAKKIDAFFDASLIDKGL